MVATIKQFATHFKNGLIIRSTKVLHFSKILQFYRGLIVIPTETSDFNVVNFAISCSEEGNNGSLFKVKIN